MENQPHIFREVRGVFEKWYVAREPAREARNEGMKQQAFGLLVKEGNATLVREMDSNLYREGLEPKLVHEKWTGLLTVRIIIQADMNLEVTMEGRRRCTRNAASTNAKPSHLRPPHLRHSAGILLPS